MLTDGGDRLVERRLRVAATAAAAGAAQASSIFFLRAGNIWVANPDGSGAKQVTTDGGYDFVSAAKTSNVLAFHRGGNSGSEYGTLNVDGSGLTANPYNSNMPVDNQFFMSRSAIPRARRFCSDTGSNYTIGGQPPCRGTDTFTDVLVAQTPLPSGSTGSSPPPSAVYCQNSTFLAAPTLSPRGQLIAATAESDASSSTTQIVTIPVSGGVSNASSQSPVTQITPANSGDTLPDLSPDVSQIAFQGPNNTIEIVPTGGGTPTPILANAATPAWSPYTLPSNGNGNTNGNGNGGGRCTVPKLKGDTFARARAALARAGCELGHSARPDRSGSSAATSSRNPCARAPSCPHGAR